jgi:hypothetical protein
MAAEDPITIIDRLNPSQLRRQIAELDQQRRALVVLLRAACARDRKHARQHTTTDWEEVRSA